MGITRWDPFAGLARMQDEIDRMFESFFPGRRGLMRVTEGLRVPSVDVEETDKDLIVRAELPGIKKEDLDLEITEDELSIKGEAKQESEKKGTRYYRRERSWGMFQRVIPLPVEVKAKEAKAVMKDGLLEVTIPKAQPTKAPEAIKIKLE